MSFARGWDPQRPDDFGLLWEHLVLERLQAHLPELPVRYWRDKQGRELDFILTRGRGEVDVIECKWEPGAFDAAALDVFRGYYPKGRNYLVSPPGDPAWSKRAGRHVLRVCTPSELNA